MTPPRSALLWLTASVIAGCSMVEAPQQLRGNRIDAEQLNELVPGTATRADAIRVLGSPTARATFDDNTWIYIGGFTRPRVGRVQGIDSQEVVKLTFDQGGVLRDVRRLTEADSQPVDVVSRTTPSPGSESSFMQQLLGNVGRFNAGGALGGAQSQAPTGGAPALTGGP